MAGRGRHSSGNFVVVWHSQPFQPVTSRDIFGRRYASSGAPFGPEFRVNTYVTSNQGYPSVAADASGNVVVVWNGYGPVVHLTCSVNATPAPEHPSGRSSASTRTRRTCSSAEVLPPTLRVTSSSSGATTGVADAFGQV